MGEKWGDFNSWLNIYGGFISLVSLVFSVIIFFLTGQIKKNIKNLLNHDKYISQKKKTKEKLEGILGSIKEDNIFDIKLIGEVSREISSLEHYSIFFDKKTKKNIEDINIILNKGFSDIESDELIKSINKVIGDLDINDIYVG